MIRKARMEDSQTVIELLFVVLEDMELPLLKLISKNELSHFLEIAYCDPVYRFGYKRGLVFEKHDQVIGVAFGYPDSEEIHVDAPLQLCLKEAGYSENYRLFEERESFFDEWYLDTIAISAESRGLGIGTALIEALPKTAKEEKRNKIGLNVDENNLRAKKLYERLGFRTVGQVVLSNHHYDHLQKKI